VKRYTTAGTASDQGKASGVLAVGVVSELLGRPVGATGTTTFRPPYVPVAFSLLAGRDRGVLADPAQVTAVHDWHLARGAAFENVGQWKRARYFPRPGEDMEAAVLRECRAAREAVAVMDASTLGKIDVQGPDAAAFLDRVYTNRMSTLPVGSCRYGMMCSADGMVLDDGVAARLGENHFLVTTTTGNAGPVLEWLEEWQQTEWPDLRVFCTSVTDHWATVAIVGPLAREVLARLAPDLAVEAGAFPFMTVREAVVAGVAARVFRISFSGELAYEVNVPAWYGRALWEAVMAAGEPLGITPYGTETMHVLRAEKGYAMVGQETDGTVTPQDLGMDWIVSKQKGEHKGEWRGGFVGRRSHRRRDTAKSDRKRLVGLLPEDPGLVLPEGAQLVERPVETPEPGAPPVPMVGHVTSAYRSATLGRSFALALVRGGTARVGERLYAPLSGRTVAVTVTEPVFYDPRGTRRDGLPVAHATETAAEPATEPAAARVTAPARAARGVVDPVRRSPAAGFATRFAAAGRDDTVRLAERPFLAMIDLRLDPRLEPDALQPTLERIEDALGMAIPRTVGAAGGDAETSALWLGPGWWLVVGPPGTEAATAARLRASLDAAPGSVVDVSAQRTALELTGPRARDVLMTGCRIDLHPRAFPAGSCAQTLLARTHMILHHLGPVGGRAPRFRVLVRASSAPYAAEWLLDAMIEHT
jgi:sarcosine oxidase subunit alpha